MNYRTTYELERWQSLEEHVEQLNRRVNDGWRADSIFREATGDSGSAIYSKTEKLADFPLTDRWVRLGDVYGVLNRIVPEYEGELRKRVRQISDELAKLRFE